MSVVVEIVILAMIAAFLGLRLYSVLGRRPEQNEEPLRRRVEQPDPSSAPRTLAPKLPEKARSPCVRRRRNPLNSQDSINRPRPASGHHRRRPPVRCRPFLAGARGAYGMVLEAFWRGDKEALGQLCDRDVYEGFAAAIDARLAAGERSIAPDPIEEAKIVSASFDAPVARITVRFTADIASVTRNADGVVVAGSLDDAIESRDLWTFSRDLTSRDPDWLLDETDEG
jgi:predicted lipid-binding transport protein (Tim44 family)